MRKTDAAYANPCAVPTSKTPDIGISAYGKARAPSAGFKRSAENMAVVSLPWKVCRGAVPGADISSNNPRFDSTRFRAISLAHILSFCRTSGLQSATRLLTSSASFLTFPAVTPFDDAALGGSGPTIAD